MERPNLVLTDTCHSEPYASPRNGSSRQTISRNRAEHSVKLYQELKGAFAKDAELKAHAVADSQGTYLEFMGSPEGDLVTKSLEDLRQGVRLLNVRQQDDVTYAAVFVPHGKENFFLDRVKEYGDSGAISEKGTAPHENLVSSIEDICLAFVDSLWTGRKENQPTDVKQWVEVWLRTGKDEDGSSFGDYTALLNELEVEHRETYILFPERMVTLVYASKSDLGKLMKSYGGLAEIREAPVPTSFFSNLDPPDQRRWIDDLLHRYWFLPETYH